MTSVTVNAPWGVLNQRPGYGKAAVDPCVCPQLPQHFRQVLASLANSHPASAHGSSLDTESIVCLWQTTLRAWPGLIRP